MLRELDVYLELSFSHWRSHVPRGSLLVSVVQGGASASPPCSRIFAVLPRLWIVASWELKSVITYVAILIISLLDIIPKLEDISTYERIGA